MFPHKSARGQDESAKVMSTNFRENKPQLSHFAVAPSLAAFSRISLENPLLAKSTVSSQRRLQLLTSVNKERGQQLTNPFLLKSGSNLQKRDLFAKMPSFLPQKNALDERKPGFFSTLGSTSTSRQSITTDDALKKKVAKQTSSAFNEDGQKHVDFGPPITADLHCCGNNDLAETIDEEELAILAAAKEENQWRKEVKENVQELQALKSQKIIKESLTRMVSISLQGNPNLEDPNEEKRRKIIELCSQVAEFDPEFILKVALYCRHELNVRSTSHLLLAFAAIQMSCRPFLPRYYAQIAHLPSDWTSVADFVQTFIFAREMKGGSLPAVLRKAMVEKFKQFDQYQLGKYASKGKKGQIMIGEELTIHMEIDNDQHQHWELAKKRFNFKRLIRLLHISEPVFHVMAILGKKYPSDNNEFYSNRLPGEFEPEKAGKRMKLPSPVTWETQISKHGNKASVWQQLIDERKLPYMATLRNLRNLVLSGISDATVDKVCAYLQNEKAVAGSRLFPFRFYSAFDVLTELATFANTDLRPPQPPIGKDKKGASSYKTKKRKQKEMNEGAIQKFRQALEAAVAIAVKRNVPPIKGSTLVICATGLEVREAKVARKISSETSNSLVVSLLFSMMVASASESAQVLTYTSEKVTPRNLAESKKSSLLEKVKDLKNLVSKEDSFESSIEMLITAKLMDLIRLKLSYDNLILVHGRQRSGESGLMSTWLNQYRLLVNPNLVYLDLDVQSGSCFDHDMIDMKNIYVAGFSEAIFQVLARVSGSGCMSDLVECMDKKYNLGLNCHQSPKFELIDHAYLSSHQWKRVRIFISSTFRDMHGERNLMTNYIFPELCRRSKSIGIEVVPVDLRWGVHGSIPTERQVEACLSEIDKCHFFVGLLGERYGNKPDIANSQLIKAKLNCQNVEGIPLGQVSMTELEMEYGVLQRPTMKENAFFFIRNHDSLRPTLPTALLSDFESDPEDSKKLRKLKEKILLSGSELMLEYPAYFAGIKEGVAILRGLESFGNRLFDVLWNAVSKLNEKDKSPGNLADPLGKQIAFCKSIEFVGRSKLTQTVLKCLQDKPGGIIEICGQTGMGSSALLAKICHTLTKTSKQTSTLVLPFFAEANGNIRSTLSFLSYLKDSLTSHLLGQETSSPLMGIQGTSKSLSKDVSTLIHMAPNVGCDDRFRLILILDGLEELEGAEGTHSLPVDWIPAELPDGVYLLISTHTRSKWSRWLSARRDKIKSIPIEPMEMRDRKLMATQALKVFGKALKEEAFDNQLNALISKREAGNPAYLKLLCLELTKYGVFEGISSQLKNLGESLESLLLSILSRLEDEIPIQVISTLIPWLVASGDLGLTEKRIANWLTNGDSAIVAVLSNGLAPFLAETQGTMMEGILCLKPGKPWETLVSKYCTSQVISEAHKSLASNYLSEYQNSDLVEDPTLLEALPYHLSQTNDVKSLVEVACSLKFVQACAHSTKHLTNLQFHYVGAFFTSKLARDKFVGSNRVQTFSRFILKHKDDLLANPGLALQLALNDPSMKLEGLDSLSIPSPPYLMILDNEVQGSGLVATKNYQPLTLTSCALEDSDLIEDDLVMMATGFNDGSISLSLAFSGLELFNLFGHSSPITALAFISGSKSSGDSYLASGSEDGEVAFWDLNSRIRLKSYPNAHARRVSGLSSSHDGLSLVSVGWDGACKVWSGRGHREVSALKQASCPYNCVAFHPEKDYIVTGDWQGLVKVWDLTSLERKAVLRGHTQASVQDLKLDASRIISVDIQGTVCVFDCIVGSLVSTFSVGQQPAFSVALVQETAFIGLGDGQIQKWDLSVAPTRQTIKFIPTSEGEEEADCVVGRRMVMKEMTAICAMKANGTLIAVGYDNGDLHIVSSSEQKSCQKSMKITSSADNDRISWITCIPRHLAAQKSPMEVDGDNADTDVVTLLVTTENSRAFAFTFATKTFELWQSLEFANIPADLITHGEPVCILQQHFAIACQNGDLLISDGELTENNVNMVIHEHVTHGLEAMASTFGGSYLATMTRSLIQLRQGSSLAILASVSLEDSLGLSLAFSQFQDKLYLVALSEAKLSTFLVNHQSLDKKLSQVIDDDIEDLHASNFQQQDSGYLLCRAKGIEAQYILRSVKGSELRRYKGLTCMAAQCTILNVEDQPQQQQQEHNVAILDSQGCIQTQKPFLGHSGLIKFLHYSPTTSSLISAAEDQTKLWHIKAGLEDSTHFDQASLVSCLALDPDTIVTLSTQGALSVYAQRPNWKLTSSHLTHNGLATSMAILEKSGHFLVLITALKRVTLWALVKADWGLSLMFQANLEASSGSPVCCQLKGGSGGLIYGLIGFDQGSYRVLKEILPSGNFELQPAERTPHLRLTSVTQGLHVALTAFTGPETSLWTTVGLKMGDNYIITANVIGQVQVERLREAYRAAKWEKVHQKAITGLVAFGSHTFITASAHSVKMWEIQPCKLVQLGEYNNGSVVTCITALEQIEQDCENKKRKKAEWGSAGLVAFGDKAGGLNILAVKKLER